MEDKRRAVLELTRRYRMQMRELGRFPGDKEERKAMQRELTRYFVSQVWRILR